MIKRKRIKKNVVSILDYDFKQVPGRKILKVDVSDKMWENCYNVALPYVHNFETDYIDGYDSLSIREKITAVHDFIKHDPHAFFKINNRTQRRKDFFSKCASFMIEDVFASIWKEAIRAEGDELLNYDFLVRGKRIDVKSKTRRVNPKSYFDVTLESYLENKKEKLDYYVFSQINEETFNIYFLGCIATVDFWDKARPVTEDDLKNTNRKLRQAHKITIMDLMPWKDSEAIFKLI